MCYLLQNSYIKLCSSISHKCLFQIYHYTMGPQSIYQITKASDIFAETCNQNKCACQ